MSKVTREELQTYFKVKHIFEEDSAKCRLEDYVREECLFDDSQIEQILADADYVELAENFVEMLNDREDDIWADVFNEFLDDWCYDNDVEF